MARPADPEGESPTAAERSRLSLWKKVLFTLFVLLLFFGVPELVLRALGLPEDLYERGIFWGVEPNLSAEPFLHKELGRRFKVSTNSRSLRYAEIPVGRQPRTVRILALGDSTTFGWGLEQDQTYPARLEHILQEKHPEVVIQVLNGGIPGYTSFQGLHHFKKNAAPYEPDIVLFGYIVQDARKTAITDKQQRLIDIEVQRRRINPLYRLRMVRYLHWKYVKYLSWRNQGLSERAEGDPTAQTRVPLADYEENILTFARLCKAQGAQLVLFGFPLEVIGYTKYHRELLASVAKREGLPHFDPSNRIHEAARRETLYFPQDKGHPNAKGCALIARLLADYLEQERLLEGPIADRLGGGER